MDYLRHLDRLQTFPRNQAITRDTFGSDMTRIDRIRDQYVKQFLNFNRDLPIRELLLTDPIRFVTYLNTLSLERYSSDSVNALIQTVRNSLVYVAYQCLQASERKVGGVIIERSGLLDNFVSFDQTEWSVSFQDRFYSWASMRLLLGFVSKIVQQAKMSAGTRYYMNLYLPMEEYLGDTMLVLTNSRPPFTQVEKDKHSFDARFSVPDEMLPTLGGRDGLRHQTSRQPDPGEPPTQHKEPKK